MAIEKDQMISLAIGRIFKMASRPENPGDIAEYERCRSLILALLPTGLDHLPSCHPRPGWNFGCGSSGCIE